MNIELVVLIVGFAIEIGVLVATISWVVAKIQANTNQLAGTIERLTAAVEKMDDKVDNHGERLAALEARGA